VLAVVMCCGLAGAAVPALAATTVVASAATDVWQASAEVPGTATLNKGDALVLSLSCASSGNCTAGGYYTVNGLDQPFVADEVTGTWGTAQAVPGIGSLNATGSNVQVVSCTSAGDCEAVGNYFAAGVEHVFAARESGGTWGTATELPSTAALAAIDAFVEVQALSCPLAGNCTAGGDYKDASGHLQPFVADETNGTWGNAQQLPLPTALSGDGDARVDSLSCGAHGDCAVVGNVGSGLTNVYQAFVADETNGTWGALQQIPGTTANGDTEVTGVSCGSAGNCAAVGRYTPGSSTTLALQAFVVDEAAGTWGNAHELAGSAALNVQSKAGLNAVSCSSAGNCSAVGSYVDAAGQRQVLADSETNGSWGTAAALPASGIASVPNFTASSLSCGSPGNCVADGYYINEGNQEYAFVAPQVAGAWGRPQSVSGAAATAVNGSESDAVSCAPAGLCVAGGSYWDGAGNEQAWLADQVPATQTTLTQSASSASYGDEQTVHLSVAVTAAAGTPDGIVTVTSGSATVCSIAIVGGAGGCTLAARQLPPGAALLTATYGGSAGFAGSSSATRQLTVLKPSPVTKVTLAAAKVPYGKEQSGRVSLTVTAPYGLTVTGAFGVWLGKGTELCKAALTAGTGSCALAATSLAPGSWQLTVTYGGSAVLAQATRGVTLTVTKEATQTALGLSVAKATYGKEQAVRITVTVHPQYAGTVAGKVMIRMGTSTVCAITLADAKGRCTLTARQLPVGSHVLTAAYTGSAVFAGSLSAEKTLTIAK
jgi:hypothetical protein